MKMLKNGEIYLYNPNKFNDAFDCWVPISFNINRKQVIDYLNTDKNNEEIRN